MNPQEVFSYFNRISSIPRGSGNTKAITEYCIHFAGEHGLKYYYDEIGNVIIYAGGTEGCASEEPIILQGHLDMVCDKKEGCMKNMEEEGPDLRTDGSYVWAEGTTLGGDDGIAVAYILALLASDDIPHPPIEALFTVDEEIGMLGARGLDASKLHGRRLINLDSEIEGVLTVSCAGGVRALCEVPLDFTEEQSPETIAYRIYISGLKGGHSGVDINRHRSNALKILGRLLEYIGRRCVISIADLRGGGRDNAIPGHAEAIVSINSSCAELLQSSVTEFYDILKKELASLEPNIIAAAERAPFHGRTTDQNSTRKLIFALMQVPDGIQTMSPDIPDMVQTSLNLGTAFIENDVFTMSFLIRSNAASGKQTTIQKLHSFIDYIDGKIVFKSDYPAWEYKMVSPLRDIMVGTYREIYADEPVVTSIHAGLECGILAGKIENPGILSIGGAVENLLLKATELGLGACWMNDPVIAEPEIKALLHTPSDYRLMSVIPVGYPAYTPRTKVMKPIDSILEII